MAVGELQGLVRQSPGKRGDSARLDPGALSEVPRCLSGCGGAEHGAAGALEALADRRQRRRLSGPGHTMTRSKRCPLTLSPIATSCWVAVSGTPSRSSKRVTASSANCSSTFGPSSPVICAATVAMHSSSARTQRAVQTCSRSRPAGPPRRHSRGLSRRPGRAQRRAGREGAEPQR